MFPEFLFSLRNKGKSANYRKKGEIFERIAKPIVDSVMDGMNGTIFAYGQVTIVPRIKLISFRLALEKLTRFSEPKNVLKTLIMTTFHPTAG